MLTPCKTGKGRKEGEGKGGEGREWRKRGRAMRGREV